MAQAVGFFTDTTVCIGCKACEVACHQWNALPARDDGHVHLTGHSYDNTGSLSDVDWRHVKFIEQFSEDRTTQSRWLMMSDICKHCVHAPCLEVCPTGAIVRTEFDSVYIQEPACNGCRDCIAACPFGVIHVSAQKHIAQKCTLCYDRLQNNLVPACAQACPTASIQFGPIEELRTRAPGGSRSSTGRGTAGRPALRARRQGPRRPELVLPADGRARGLRAPRRGRPPGAEPGSLAVVDQERSPRAWRWPSGVFAAFGRRKKAVAEAESPKSPEPKAA